MVSMPDDISAELPVRLSRVREFAAEVEAFGQAAGLPDAKVYIVNLTLDELIANVVMYGFEGVADPRIDVKLTVSGDKLVLVLEDNGRPFDPTQDSDADITSSLMDRPVGGLGRYFVKRLADRIAYEHVDGRNRVTAEYDLAGD
jgi:anti-sigma regulatory factor (Ser/Thr protein kinase)